MHQVLSILKSVRARYLVMPLLLVILLFVMVPGARAESADSPEASSGFYYTVQWGDTMYKIANRYGTTVYAIASANHIVNPNYIYAGQVLWIPQGYAPAPVPPVYHPPAGQCRYYHTVTWGDTMIKLGQWYGVSPWSIAQANGIYNMNLIYRGQTLCIP